MLTFVVAILTVVARYTISPAQTGVVLTYILSVQQVVSYWFASHDMNVLTKLNCVGIWLDGTAER